MTSRKKPGVAFWATVVVVVALIGYPLSFGPVCWWFSTPLSSRIEWTAWEGPDPRCPPQIYWPIGWLAENAPGPVGDAIFWFAGAFQPVGIALPTSPSRSPDASYSDMEHTLKRLLDGMRRTRHE
jgi:hypothetical protein